MTLNALTEFDECISDWTIAALSIFSNHLADLWTRQRFDISICDCPKSSPLKPGPQLACGLCPIAWMSDTACWHQMTPSFRDLGSDPSTDILKRGAWSPAAGNRNLKIIVSQNPVLRELGTPGRKDNSLDFVWVPIAASRRKPPVERNHGIETNHERSEKSGFPTFQA